MMRLEDRDLPDSLYTVSQVRALDRLAIEKLNIPAYCLMQRAATFAYQALKQYWSEARSILVICGSGHNAGDGYVLARLAKEDAKQVTVISLTDPQMLTGAAAKAYRDMLEAGLELTDYSTAAIQTADVIVDALLGIGLNRDVEGAFADVINAINASETPVLAIDIPSGLNADNGRIMNVAIEADLTTSFIGLKQGMFTGDGLQCSGKIEFNDLGVSADRYQSLGEQTATRLNLQQLSNVLKPRKKNVHKGHFGHVLIVGGDRAYSGAARMAAEASARVGAGLVSIATRAAHASQLSAARPEIMAHAVETLDELLPLIKHANVIAIGPGLGHSEWAKLLLARVLESKLPLLIDADALNLLAKEWHSSENQVITPHPGEAARLLGLDSLTIQSDRFHAAKCLHEKYRGSVVLKGSGTIVLDNHGDCFVCDAGNPGMSSGGMGDVLTGVIVGLIAQGIDVDHATKLGVCLHAHAADKAANIRGERGLMASDLMPYLHDLVNP